METLELFIVKSKDGKYFRSKGYNGYGDSWVDSISKAKIYSKIGSARSQVTFWASHYPEYGIPDIVLLTISESKILNEEERVKKAIRKIKKNEIEYKIRSAEYELNRILNQHLKYNDDYINEAKEKVENLKKQHKQL